MIDRKRALVLYGGWEGHHPELLAERYVATLEQLGFAIEAAAQLDVLDDAEAVARFDLLLPLWTMGELSERREAALVGAVRGGVGLVGVHGSADAFRSATGYQLALGGQFVWHPEQPLTYHVRFVDACEPLTVGLDNFTVTGEQYHVHVDPAVHVVATTTVSAGWPMSVEMPVAWTRRFGAGRVFYCSVGHEPAAHDIPQMRELMRRALRWAARS
jgi:uncharacterized protein